MRIRASRSLSLLVAAAVSGAGLAGVSGCGDQTDASDDTDLVAHRAREVARAWDGSTAAAAWRAGYHPMGEVVQLPRGGLRSQADKQAYQDHNLALRGTTPETELKNGQVTWAGSKALTRPLTGAAESYKALSGGYTGAGPHLTVTGARLGEMRVATSRGPATVPAWLFALDGYDSPLKQAAVMPSSLPRPPIGRANDIPGHSLDRLVRIAADGRSATVVALHGACDDGPVVDVLETDGSVVLSGAVKPRKDGGSVCTKQARLQQVTVKLAHPVGNRVVLDAYTGQPVPYKPPHGLSPSWS